MQNFKGCVGLDRRASVCDSQCESGKSSVTRTILPNVYKICPKIISLEKLKILTPLQKMSKNVGDLGNLNIFKGF